MSAILSYDTPSRLRRPGIAAGIAISLALHALLLFGYRQPLPPPPAPATAMTVWLQPLKPPQLKLEPPPKPVPAKQPELAKTAPKPRRAPAQAPVHEPETPVAAATPPQSAASQAITLPTAPDPLHPDQQPKKFDMNAALKTARKVANEKDPARAGTPLAQLDDHPLYPEDNSTKLQRDMASAKKTDCLQSGAGAGLLAPLVWMMDKHCKF